MLQRGSVIIPVVAAAAATIGLQSIVRAPCPWRPSKFLLEVESDHAPDGTLSSFMARHAEHPGCLISKPASVIILSSPSAFIFLSTSTLPFLNVYDIGWVFKKDFYHF